MILPTGKVVTFYSYKGGTGRTMAMSNVAWILASNGHRVLAIDWDLEAPGLHRFLGPVLSDPEQKTTTGLIDFLMEYVIAATRGHDDPDDEPWYEPYTNLIRFAQPVTTGFAKGRIDMIGAGRQNAEYAERVNLFDWRSFYERFQGHAFLDAVFAKLRERYDFILIDSRTGVSDTAGVCTVQLPDALVVMFTMNVQSIDGASAVALDARRQRDNDLAVFPIPSRIELAEVDRLQRAREAARQRFSPIVKRFDTPGHDYLVDMEIPHVAYYLYDEQLAAVVEAGRPPVLLGIYERLAAHVSEGRATKLAPLPEKELEAVRARFRSERAPGSATATKPAAPKRYDVFLSYSSSDGTIARRIHDELSNLMTVFDASLDVLPGQNIGEAMHDAIRASSAVVVLFRDNRSSTRSPWTESSIELARADDIPVIPVRLGHAQLPDSLRDVSAIEGSVDDPGHIAEQVRSAVLATDRGGRGMSERIAYLYADRNKLQTELNRRRRYLLGIAVSSVFAIAGGITATYLVSEQTAQDSNIRLNEALARTRETELSLQNKQRQLTELDDSINAKKATLADSQVQLLSLESEFEQTKDQLDQLQRSPSLPQNVRSAIDQTMTAQHMLRQSVQEVAKQASAAAKPSEIKPIVLVFAAPDETGQQPVQDAATTLESKGFSLGKKRVFPGRPPNGVTEVRYFRNPDDRNEANQILDILTSSAHLPKGRISFVVDPDIKRPRYFEVRLAKKAFPTASR